MAAKRIYVRPKRGMKVPNPHSGYSLFPPEGQYVLRSTFINRRIAEGDLLEMTEEEAAALEAKVQADRIAEDAVATEERETALAAQAEAEAEEPESAPARRSRRKE